MASPVAALQAWYGRILSRRIDLVGDYAGNELFVIEGDSLLLHCFSDPRIDLTRGYQLLHAVYCVEKFLADLKRRKCNFHVVFFDSQESLCIPLSCPPGMASRYRLARYATIRHLQQNLSSGSGIQVKSFTSPFESNFATYMNDAGVYFVMCHDGSWTRAEADAVNTPTSEATSDEEESDSDADETETEAEMEGKSAGDEAAADINDDDVLDFEASGDLIDEDYTTELSSTIQDTNSTVDAESTLIDDVEGWTLEDVPMSPAYRRKIAMRGLINWFILAGYDVALINDVTFVDTKVFSMVLEGSSHNLTKFPEDQLRSLIEPMPASTPLESDAYLQAMSATSNDYSDREILSLAAITNLLQTREIDSQQAALLVLSNCIMQFVPLANRSFQTGGSGQQRETLQKYIDCLVDLTRHEPLQGELSSESTDCADMVDGRLFFNLGRSTVPIYANQDSISSRFQELGSFVKQLVGVDLQLPTPKKFHDKPGRERPLTSSVLPFENAVFDKHLAPVRLQTTSEDSRMSASKSKVFRELSHWHNHKRTVAQRGETVKLDKWALKRNQRFMAEMITYAASLTNAAGKILDPEVIIATGKAASAPAASSRDKKPISDGKPNKMQSQNQKAGKKPAQQGKKSGKEAALEAAAARTAEKAGSKASTAQNNWEKTRKELEKEDDDAIRFVKTQKHLMSLSSENAATLGAEVQLFCIRALANLWQRSCDSGDAKQLGIVASIWKICLELQKASSGVSDAMKKELISLTKQLGLPSPELQVTSDATKLPFSLSLSKPGAARTKSGAVSGNANPYGVGMASREFQLQHCGPYFDRTIDAKDDPRVPFQPDAWQRKVLDAIDADKSLFVVAPTSAGKTFISFYAMRQVLKVGDEGVVVYVAPTKALVNQIAAEVQARFSKSFKGEAKSVWGIHTRDYRINNPTGCQILVTVPHILQIMLLAPAHAEKKNSWAYRIKRIIFDEVHCIGQAEDGIIWEQLLLQASCPIIALSATVGNPKEFGEWLESTQKASGNELITVEHHTRYSDLRKFIYNAPETSEFTGLPARAHISTPGLDGSETFSFVHPVAGLTNRARGMPSDLNLEARDCYSLWESLSKHQTGAFLVPDGLSPGKYLPEIIRKVDVLRWETELKALLHSWMIAADSPYDKVVAELQPKTKTHATKSSQGGDWMSLKHSTTASSEGRLLETTLPLLNDLASKDALPAILFNFDRRVCEAIAQDVVKKLEAAEAAWKENDSSWKKTEAEFEKYQKDQEKIASKTKGAAKTTKKKGARGDDDEPGSKADRERGAADTDGSKWATFDPKAPLEGFSFADKKKVALSDLEDYTDQLRYRGVDEWFITALYRGVGVHHAGMNRKYRQVVEILFRKGFLHVVIATGTLALGINMPCKTVVFSGDSVFLTALQYRQCAGRAGRRGFDVLGNVVFQDIHYSKVCTLLSSRLPDLNGHFPITTTLVLRLATLLHETKNSEFAVRSFDAILSQPRFVLGGTEEKSAVLHHLRFSIDYLRRQNLLGPDGAPLNFAGLASHLYYTESAAWAFHALIKEGYFHALAKNVHKKPKQTALTLMLVLAHIFGRYPCRRADAEYYEQFVKRSPSVVFLPDLPADAKKVLMKHNRETLGIFKTYVKTYAEQHMADSTDNVLPLSGTEIGPRSAEDGSTRNLEPTTVRSHFVALSGHTDSSIGTISDLCTSARSGIFLEEGVVPYLPVWNKDEDPPLNAYLYDFYKHGDVKALTRANRVRPGEVWFVLNDFSLVLATIVTTLMNYMKLSPVGDADMTDLMGSGEALEEKRDDAARDREEARKTALQQQQATAAAAAATRRPKERVADSWESAADEMEKENKRAAAAKADGAYDDEEFTADGGGLMNVLKAFQLVREEFDAKFKNMWA